ncbi:hypothetical protein Patl1_19801 [Pistacia atlantica]|uniref:Uncharacterized protein n=1 Tax=Pistacia atlantica TaxID=434234 RepID=A0ACC1BNT5_9ROSI|nr:hypothetical protein Patl1_19801 [Pistacia atlantica]
MENGTVEDGVCSKESVNGSQDVWSCKNSDSSSADHLVVMVHGILGSANDWKFGAEQFVKWLPDKVFVHCSERNMSTLSLDGVDVMGQRLVQEVLEVIQRKPNLRKISFVGHSVGGLVARYAIGRLYKPPRVENVDNPSAETCEKNSCGTIGDLEAMNFVTVATPHLGSRGYASANYCQVVGSWPNDMHFHHPRPLPFHILLYVPFLFGVPALEKLANAVIHLIFRRTGRHLFLNDNDEGKPPLLRCMIEDHGENYFMSALRTFKRRVAYSNVGYDHIVGWRTSSIRRDSELPKWEDSLHEKYPHIVHEEHCKACDAEPNSMEDSGSDKLEEELVTGLSRVSWEKIGVSFHSSRQRLAAHSVIQVKDEAMHIEGADVIHHIIDHFLTPNETPERLLDFDAFLQKEIAGSFTRGTAKQKSYPNPLQKSQAYAVVKKTFVSPEDVVTQRIVIQKDSPRGVHFRRAGPREKVYFKPEDVCACIVTCGGLCPGINTVIREIVCGLNYMYGVDNILGIEVSISSKNEACLNICQSALLNGFYVLVTWEVIRNKRQEDEAMLLVFQTPFCMVDTEAFTLKIPWTLNPKVVNDIHKRGGTFLRTSRGVEKRGLQVAVAGIPKTIDNDIAVIDKSFGFDTAVEEAQRAINAAHVEVESVENGVGIVKLMGRYSGFIAMYATLASRDVDCCLIPESPFYLEGQGGLFEFIEQRLKENGHMVIVVAEGAGQDYVSQSTPAVDEKDASGNRLLLDIGHWLTQKIKDHFTNIQKMTINMKYIDPTYMIRAIPSNASDNIYCTLLAQSAVHGAMAGFTGFTVGPVNNRHAYIPISHVTETQKTVKLTDRMWARLLASTNQPIFLA